MKRSLSNICILTACMLAGPSIAQDTMCGGAGRGGNWIGGSVEASDITGAKTYREQMALVLGGNEYVALFSLSEPTAVRVEAAGRGAGDPLIDLLDSTGAVLVSDDDSGGNGAARIETELDSGDYCVVVNSYDNAPMTAFVRVGSVTMDALTDGSDNAGTTPSDTDDAEGCAAATPLGTVGDTVSGNVDETPYWSFSLDSAAAISITATNEDADPVLSLMTMDNTQIAENDDFDGLNARIDVSSPLDAGQYCIKVGALNDTSLPIEIAITAYDAEAALAGLYDRGEAAPPLDGSVPVTAIGMLDSRLRQDAQVDQSTTWFSLDVADSGLLLVEAIAAGGNGDPWLVLYDDLGRQVAQNDDYGSGYDSLVTARVNPGTYIVGVKQVGDNQQGFVRLLFERYVPAP